MKRIKEIRWGIFMAAMVVGCSLSMSVKTYADGPDAGEVKNGWLNEELGPGAAKWVDENGNITAPPSDQPQQESQEQGPGMGVPGTSQNVTPSENQAEVVEDVPESVQRPAETQPQPAEQPAPETQPAETQPETKQNTGERHIDPSKPMIALTFDDGPYASVGNQIMDCLAKYGGKATFFVVGDRVANYKTEIKRMAAEGHEIGNHTYNHKYLNKLSAAEIEAQISKCNNAVEAACGVRPKLVRLPGGLKNQTVLAHVHAPMIMWNIDTEDWKTKNAQKTINAVIGKVHDGDIVLMHELYKQSGAAAVDIIPKLVSQGYQLVTVSELAQYRGGVKAGGVYYNFRK